MPNEKQSMEPLSTEVQIGYDEVNQVCEPEDLTRAVALAKKRGHEALEGADDGGGEDSDEVVEAEENASFTLAEFAEFIATNARDKGQFNEVAQAVLDAAVLVLEGKPTNAVLGHVDNPKDRQVLEASARSLAQDIENSHRLIDKRHDEIIAYAEGSNTEPSEMAKLYGDKVKEYMAQGMGIDEAYASLVVAKLSNSIGSSLPNVMGQNLT